MIPIQVDLGLNQAITNISYVMGPNNGLKWPNYNTKKILLSMI